MTSKAITLSFVDPAENLHPYECNGIGACCHCDRLPTPAHHPATCDLCDPEYDYAPNPYRPEQNTGKGQDA